MIQLPKTMRFSDTGPEPGVYHDVPAPEYFRWPFASKSLLKQVLDCPTDAHLYRELSEPQTMTAALADGSAYDCMVLEPHRFAEDYVIAPKMTRKGKEWDAILQQAGSSDRVIWAEDDVENPQRLDYKTLQAMHEALRAKARTRKCIASPGAKAQVSIVWDDAATGLRCKARFDRVLPGHVLLDLKTAESAEREAFGWACFDYGYDIQAAMYCDGYKATFGVDPTFLFLVQEKHGGYESAIYDATDERERPTLAECGRVRARAGLERLAKAITAGTWGGYSDEPMPVYVPAKRIPEGVEA